MNINVNDRFSVNPYTLFDEGEKIGPVRRLIKVTNNAKDIMPVYDHIVNELHRDDKIKQTKDDDRELGDD